MGMAGLKELTRPNADYEVTVLARPSKKNRQKLAPFINKGIKVIWGDLLDEKKLKEGIASSDIVLHVGGMVSPQADKYPLETIKVNVGSMKLISSIVKDIESKGPDREIKLVYIGSVSQYGSHLPPGHWGEVGRPLKPALRDAYAYSKILAERILIESDVKKWVSLRQTSILHKGLLSKTNDPIMFHVPLAGVLEWISVEDSGRLLERVCRNDVPDDFWCDIYNIGGGSSYRMDNFTFEKKIMKAVGCPSPDKIFERNWFATHNFHGIWFKDSDSLQKILNFRSGETFDEALSKLKRELPFYFKIAPIVPSIVIKMFMKKVAESSPLGTLHILNSCNKEMIDILWGGKDKQKSIGGWKDLDLPELSKEMKDTEKKDESKIIFDRTLHEKKCEKGHTYLSSEFLEKRGGHGCPACLRENAQIDIFQNNGC